MGPEDTTVGTGNETGSQTSTDDAKAVETKSTETGGNTAQTGGSTAQTDDAGGGAPDLSALAPADKSGDGEGDGGSEPPAAKKEGEKDAPEDAPLEIKTPEGFKRDEELMKNFLSIAKDSGIKQDAAQKLFDMHSAEMRKSGTAFENAARENMAKLDADWNRQCREHPEFGGANFKASQNRVVSVIGKVFPEREKQEQFIDFMTKSNLRNAPILFEMYCRLDGMIGEPEYSGSSAGGAKRENSFGAMAARMFPDAK